MVEDDGKETDEGDTGRKETPDNSKKDNIPTTTPKEDTGTHFVSSPVIEAAKAENDRKEKLLDREDKLMARREKLHAEQMVGGHTVAGQEAEQVSPEQKKKDQAQEFFKDTALGDAIKKTNE